MFSQPSLILDLLTSGWVVLVFIILFGLLPLLAFRQVSIPSLASRIVGAFVRTTATIGIGGILWTKLGLFTWITAVLCYLTGLGIGWIASDRWQYRGKFQQLSQQIALSTIDIFDRGLSLPQLSRWLLSPWRAIERLVADRLLVGTPQRIVPNSSGMQIPSRAVVPKERLHPNDSANLERGSRSLAATRHHRSRASLPSLLLTAIVMLSIGAISLWLRFEHPITEFRFSHPDTYGRLLVVQQILARDLPQINYLPIFPSLAAFLTALSGVHPLQVVHLLGAIIGTLLVLGVGYTMRCLSKNGAAALAASYSLGAYLFTWNLPIPSRLPLGVRQCLGTLRDTLDLGLIRSWAASESELGALFVILAIGCSTQIAKSSQRTASIVNTSCCALLALALDPTLPILILFGWFGGIFGRQMALFSLSMGWLILGVLATIPTSGFAMLTGILTTLPIGLSLLVGLLFIAIASAGRLLLANWSAPICLTIFLAITLNFFLPPSPQIDYLEYDAAARKAVEIGYLFPHQQWTVVAPIEQLSQVYGRGWYEDAARFTTRYRDRVTTASFVFPHQTTLLIFVEKRPFISDKPEYPVPYSVLIDPTYRNYRSPSGRTQLAAAMLQMCETYRRHHPDLHTIYYESDRLRIYQFSPASMDNKKSQLTISKFGTNNQGASTTPISMLPTALSGRI
ncbi:hypothetical protein [Chamaesiphon polymorphus]|uniref:Uncharacterized protein n=1 Tax=Chamaesiphon polymorphus CCALA 037 TaxID=2107692 RepID=A0A2T1GK91_9CYAN|nr:hypothetical protein [Chamaesiphon polymorphus]PSB58244.1 hypothetical protein C7B77_05415 [Chamaesiphon polymorphus CCALA 037]